jgi:uncharacterized protein (TIGR03435 family)
MEFTEPPADRERLRNSKSQCPGPASLPEAMQKQFGLKLQMEKRPIPVLVVDHVNEKPAEN